MVKRLPAPIDGRSAREGRIVAIGGMRQIRRTRNSHDDQIPVGAHHHGVGLFAVAPTVVGSTEQRCAIRTEEHEGYIRTASCKAGLHAIDHGELGAKGYAAEPGSALQIIGSRVAKIV